MSEFIQIQWCCGSLNEARKVCRFLIQERYAACANIIPWVESIFMWDNKLETAQETKVLIKTRMENYDVIREVITSNTSYELPEITFTKIDGGSEEYMSWLEQSAFDHSHKPAPSLN